MGGKSVQDYLAEFDDIPGTRVFTAEHDRTDAANHRKQTR